MRNSKLASVALVAMIALSTVFAGGAFAATPTVDTTNDADSTTTSDLTDGSTIANFTANESNNTYVEVSFDQALDGDAKIQFLDPDTADTVDDMEVVYTNASADEVNATSFNYAWNITHDELGDLPVDHAENKTFKVRMMDSQDEANATIISVNVNNTGERAVYRVGDSFTDSDVDTEEAHPYLGDYISSYEGDTASFDIEDVPTTDNTTHTVNLDNGTVADAFALASEDKDDGAWMPAMTLMAEGDDGTVIVPVFVNEKNDDWDFLDDDEAYAVYDTDSDSIEFVTNGDERFEDTDETDISMAGNSDLGLMNAVDMFNGLDAGYYDTYTKSIYAL